MRPRVAKTAADKLTARPRKRSPRMPTIKDLKDAVAAAEKESVDAEAKKKTADEAKVAADKVFTDAETARKTAETNKQTADKAATDALTAFNTADQKVKQVTPNYQKAIDERTAAERTLQDGPAGRRTGRRSGEEGDRSDSRRRSDRQRPTKRPPRTRDAGTGRRHRRPSPMTEKPLKSVAFSPDGAIFVDGRRRPAPAHLGQPKRARPVEVYPAPAPC